MPSSIYLDNNAATFLDPKVRATLLDFFSRDFGNPSSMHADGRRARAKLILARDRVAKYFSVSPRDIIFTSGGTESIHLALLGLAQAVPPGHLITSHIEHFALVKTIEVLEKMGWDVTRLPVGEKGAIEVDDLCKAIRSNTRLIALSAVNNETGVKIDLDSIASIANEAGILFFVDAVALLGKEEFQIPFGVSALAFSAQKCHGPKGVGLALIKGHLPFSAQLLGGDQEMQKRAGTENLGGIVAMAEAIAILKDVLPQASHHMANLRDRFEEGIFASLKGVHRNGRGLRISNTTNLSFDGVDGESFLIALDMEGVSASLGSACMTGALKSSHVLESMGLSKERVQSAIRFSLSRFTTKEEIERAVEIVVRTVNRLRNPRLGQ